MKTLRELYEAKGTDLPTVQEQAILADMLNVCKKELYIGTIEQREMLLRELEARERNRLRA